jgi:hypothetical protein
MGNNVLADSYISTGAAVGFNRGMSPERQAERSGAYALKEERDQDLRNLKATEPTDADRENMADTQTLELQNALETQKQMLRDNNRRTTFDAYTRYDQGDGDVKHINTMINDLNKQGSTIFGKITRVDKVTENDRQMLENAGYTSSYIDMIINDPDMNKSLIIYTLKDGGGKEIGNLDDLKGLTGYNDYASQTELNRQKISRETALVASLGYSVGPNTPEAFRRAVTELERKYPGKTQEQLTKMDEFHEAYTKHLDTLRKSSFGARGYGRTENETEVEQAAANRARLEGFNESDPGWTEAYERNKSEIWAERRETSASRNVGSASTAEDELLEMGFLEMDIPELTQTEKVKIEQKVRTIEQLGGAKLDITTKKSLTDIRKLTSLGKLGSELTDEQTGLIDNIYRMVRRYVSDNVEGIAATSAYSHFRNLAMNALYGGQLTPNEAKQFRKAFGSLGQQRGPVLAQFRVALQATKDSYEAILATENDMVIKWRTGQTGDDLYAVIDALDERIELISEVENAKPGKLITTVNPPPKAKAGTVIRPEIKAEMDRLRGKQ